VSIKAHKVHSSAKVKLSILPSTAAYHNSSWYVAVFLFAKFNGRSNSAITFATAKLTGFFVI
jgi:hypothetical protein